MQGILKRAPMLGAVLLVVAPAGHATTLEFFGLEADVRTRVVSGMTWRTQDPNRDLLPKVVNTPGLCDEDDCMSFTGDPEPNQRLVDAPGAYSAVNFDDGNLNYDKGDVVAATTYLTPELKIYWRDFTLNATGLLYYDWENVNFDETHLDTRFQPASTPRPPRYEREFAQAAEIRDLNLQTYFNALGREFLVRVGRQTIPWGESNLVLFNSTNEINPLDGAVAGFPGFEIADVLIPVGAALVQTSITDYLSAELVYQFEWEGVRPPPPGSFLSTNDVATQGLDANIGLGQFNDDPNGLFEPAEPANLLTTASRTVDVLPEPNGFPDDGGQYGVRLSYYAENINFGTEFGFYFLNYHSRFPVLSVFAADRSCLRDGAPGDPVTSFAACGGPMSLGGDEPLPLDTLDLLVEYPEDIRMFGLSANTNVGDWALSGEVTYRPNLPLQVHLTDVLFAGLGPAVPEEDLVVGVGPAALTVPGEESIFPDYLDDFRGTTIAGNQYVAGFERFKASQISLTGIRILSQNPFGADQILFLVEGGASYISDLPDIQELPLQGPGDFTHPTPGADGTGAADGQPDSRRINPTQQTTGLPTEFAWGLRSLARFTYNEVLPGVTLEPNIIAFWDVKGYSASPLFNFIEGRKQIVANALFKKGPATLGFQYVWFTGGGVHHLERDRDNAGVFAAYNF